MNLDPGVMALLVLLNGAFSIVVLFFGYRIFRWLLLLLGFGLGGLTASAVGVATSDSYAVGSVSFLLGGIVGGALLYAFYFVGVFVLGAFLGMLLAALLSGGSPTPAVSIALAVLFGTVAIFFQKLVIVVATSVNGASGTALSVAYFVTGGAVNPLDPNASIAVIAQGLRFGSGFVYVLTLSMAALAVLGVIAQFRSSHQGAGAPHPNPARSLANDRSS